MAAFDYSIKAPDPIQGFTSGYDFGVALQDRERKRLAEEQAMQAAQARQAEIQRIQTEFYQNPTPKATDIIRFSSTLEPQMVTALKDQFAALPQEAQGKELQMGAQVISSLLAKDGVTAAKIMRDRAEAERETNPQKAQQWGALASLAEKDTDIALRSIAPLVGVLPNGDKVLQSAFDAQQRPALIAESEAKAQSAATAAKFAESKAIAELKLNDAQIKKLAADAEIARMNARIALIRAQNEKEGNAIERRKLDLKLEEMVMQRDEKVREKVATVESGRMNMDNMLNTIDRLLNNPSLNDVIGSFEGRMPEAASMLDDEESNAIALINTLGSQAFLAQIPNIKGMGALSNAEGEKLQSALQNLSRPQGEKQFRSSLGEAQRLILKARKNLGAQYGVRESAPDTPAARPSGAEVDAILKELGVK